MLGTEDDESERVFRVAELNRLVRLSLERSWAAVWIEGEVSNLTRAASGHCYFSLLDEESDAQIRAVMFRGDTRRGGAALKNGARIRVCGTVTLYEARGSFQVIVRRAQASGAGDLRAQFEQLRRELTEAGLLDQARKKALPSFPRTVGIVTSRSGAALQDILRVSRERAPLRLIVAHAQVQGREAPSAIRAALQRLLSLPEVEVVILARGGGSAEDLAAFNDRGLALQIAEASIPIVSGVGHESDLTIADLVADLRAATPSNAAELVVPDAEALTHELEDAREALARAFALGLGRRRIHLQHTRARLSDPSGLLQRAQRTLGHLERELQSAVRQRLGRARAEEGQLSRALMRQEPRQRLREQERELNHLQATLHAQQLRRMHAAREKSHGLRAALAHLGARLLVAPQNTLASLSASLDALSPLAVLSRGYAIALDAEKGQALREASPEQLGRTLTLHLHRGHLSAQVTEVHPSGDTDTEGTAR